MPPRNLKIASGEYRGTTIHYRAEHVIVKFKQFEYRSEEATDLLNRHFGARNYELAGVPVGQWTYLWVNTLPEKLLAIIDDLDSDPDTEFAEPDLTLSLNIEPSDPLLTASSPPVQWAVKYLNMYQAWDVQSGTADVVIGLLDSGVPLPSTVPVPPPDLHANLETQLNHADLDGVRFIAGHNPVADTYWPADDYDYHGTQMAGIIAAMADNKDDAGNPLGTAGINWGSTVYAYKAFHGAFEDDTPADVQSTGALIYYGILETVAFAKSTTPEKRVVINLSGTFIDEDFPGLPTGTKTLTMVLDEIVNAKAILCVAAGDVRYKVLDPGNTAVASSKYAENVIVVGAVQEDDACMESYAHGLDDMVYAPGVEIGTTTRDDGYTSGSGTSQATAHVSALAAAMWSAAPDLEAKAIVAALKATCRDPATSVMETFGGNKGHGIVEGYKALKKIKTRVCLVLDKSGSMSEASGIGGKTRLDLMKTVANDLVDLVDVGSSLGAVAFNESAETVHDPAVIEVPAAAAGGVEVPGSRAEIQSEIDALEAGGFTCIGAGVKDALAKLGELDSPRAIIILTDGRENWAPFLSAVAVEDGTKIYAIGMGTPEVLQPSGLETITENTDGYLILSENFTDGDGAELTKFLVQIIGEITGTGTVLDPVRRIQVNQTHEVQVVLGEADTSAEIILVKAGSVPLKLYVVAPNSDEAVAIDAKWTSDSGRVARYQIALPASHVAGYQDLLGDWRIQVALPMKDYLAWVVNRGDFNPTERNVDRPGLPYALSVNSRTTLKLHCRVRQSGYVPGSMLTLQVDLMEHGLPVDWPFELEVSLQDRHQNDITLERATGEASGSAYTALAQDVGTYKWIVWARAGAESPYRFQRECRLTSAIWNPTPLLIQRRLPPSRPIVIGPVTS
jgi:Mg-chelatase subunit ChlD